MLRLVLNVVIMPSRGALKTSQKKTKENEIKLKGLNKRRRCLLRQSYDVTLSQNNITHFTIHFRYTVELNQGCRTENQHD